MNEEDNELVRATIVKLAHEGKPLEHISIQTDKNIYYVRKVLLEEMEGESHE